MNKKLFNALWSMQLLLGAAYLAVRVTILARNFSSVDALVLAVEIFGVINALCYLSILNYQKVKTNKRYVEAMADVVVDARNSSDYSLTRTLIAISELRHTNNIYVLVDEHNSHQDLIRKYAFNIITEIKGYDEVVKSDHVLITNCNEVLYPDAIHVSLKNIEDAAFCELASSATADLAKTKINIINTASSTHAFSIYNNGPIVAKTSELEYAGISVKQSKSKIAQALILHAGLGSITSTPCFEPLDVDHNIKEAVEIENQTIFSKGLLSKFITVFKTNKTSRAKRLALYGSTSILRGVRTALIFVASLACLVSVNSFGYTNITTITATSIFYITAIAFAYWAGDRRSVKSRLQQSLYECESAFRTIFSFKSKISISAIILLLVNVAFGTRILLENISSIYDQQQINNKNIVYAIGVASVICLSISMKMVFVKAKRSAVRRVVSLKAQMPSESVLITDLTDKGAGVLSGGVYEIGEVLTLTFLVPTLHSNKKVSISGEIRNISTIGSKNKYGIEFNNVADNDMTAISYFANVLFPYSTQRKYLSIHNIVDLDVSTQNKNKIITKRQINKQQLLSRVASIVILICVTVSMIQTFKAASASPGDSPITGTVWLDTNGNGSRSAPGFITDSGYAGVTITAYDSIGSTPVTAISASDGTYSINVTSLGSGPYRLELTVPNGYSSSPIGSQTSSTVRQSVIAGASGVDFAIEDSNTYCASNPRLILSCFANGNGQAVATNSVASLPSSKILRFNDSGYIGQSGYVTPTNLTTQLQIGTTYGMGSSRATDYVYAGAFLRRHAALGPNGMGAIYEINPDTGAVVRTITIPSAGTVPSGRDLPTFSNQQSRDINTFAQVGKSSLGDVDVIGDGKTLFTTNLNTRQLVRVDDIDTATPVVTQYSLPASVTCPGGDSDRRLMGLGNRKVSGVQKVYVGVTCTGETRAVKTTSDLVANIVEFDFATNAWGSTILSVPLNYSKGCANLNPGYPNLGCAWNTWSDNYNDATHIQAGTEWFISRPQPLVSDIDFDDTGAMVIGIADRGGWQWGDQNLPPTASSGNSGWPFYIPNWDQTNQYNNYFGAGDQLRACLSSGTYTIENNGSCGGITTAGSNNNQGIGGGEYYQGDNKLNNFPGPFPVAGVYGHEENGLGALAFVPGRSVMAATVTDPFYSLDGVNIFHGYAVGVAKLAHTNDAASGYSAGQWVGALETGHRDSGSNQFGKAGGLGDIEVLCDNAPIEIGNFVWADTDRDGIQDPNEQPLQGITVQLYDTVTSSVVGTAKTDVNGKYIFASEGTGNVTENNWDGPLAGDDNINDAYGIVADPDSNLGNAKYGIKENRAYEVRFNTSTATLTSYQDALLTTPNADASPNGDIRDSDATMVSSVPTVALTTGVAGDNSHIFDVGFVKTYSIGNRVWNDLNNDGIDNNSESGISNVNVRLYKWVDANSDSNVQTGELVQVATGADGILGNGDDSNSPVVTNVNGFYRFQKLDAGNYIVEVDTPSTYLSSSGTNGSLTGPYETSVFPISDVADGDVNANDDGNKFSATVTRSRPYTLGGAPVEPTGEKEVSDNISDDTSDQSSNLSIDFGFYIPASLGNYVWRDINNDGIQDSGEPGTNGVTVTLRQPGIDNTAGTIDDVVVATTTTADDPNIAGTQNGWYYFNNLNQGNYFVTFTNMPANSIFTTPDVVTANDQTDSDADITTGRTIITNISVGEDDPTWDAGWFIPNMSVGNRVWIDLNHNGIDDNGEAGLASAHVKLYNSSGVQIQAGADGILGNGDDGTAAVITDSNGHYLFTQLLPGSYYIEVTNVSNNYISTSDTADVTIDSVERDDNGVTPISGGVRSGTFVLTLASEPTNDDSLTTGWADAAFDSDSNYTLDFGFFKEFDLSISKSITNLVDSPFSLGDYVNYSVTVTNEGPGDADAGYKVVDTLPVGVDASSINILSSTGFTTSISGSEIAFVATSGLANGDSKTITYRARVSANPSAPSVDRTNYVYVDKSPTDRDEIIKLTDIPTNNKDNAVFPLAAGSSIGDRVWYDANRNGLQDNNEAGVSGINVELFRFDDDNSDGIVDSGELVSIGTDTTDSNGYYGSTKGTSSFQNLSPNKKYKVIFTNVPNDYNISPESVSGSTPAISPNGSPTNDSDVNTSTLETELTMLSANETDVTWDMGIYRATASLGDRVWYDSDRDGLQDGGEPGKSGVTVNLYKWTDTNEDGIIDSGEVSSTPIASDTTDSNGNYLFEDLDPGLLPTQYMVEFILPSGYQYSPKNVSGSTAPNSPNDTPTNDSDADTATGRTKYTTLNSSEQDLTFDAGIFMIPAEIGNKVFYDLDEDGIQDSGEGPVAGVTVELLTSSGTIVGTDVTDASGIYGFNLLEPGEYSVRFVLNTLPSGYAPTFKNQAPTEGDTDSDANRSNGTTALTTLSPGENDPSWDMGIVPRAAIGDRVWYDKNRNGIADSGELGVPGVSIQLLNSSGVVIDMKPTDSNGEYHFTDLPLGDYQIKVVLSSIPGGYVLTGKNVSTSTVNNDSDANVSTGEMSITTLTVGENDLSWDAGIYQPTASLGDFVWFDSNINGIQDSGEKGIAGVTVKLFDASNDSFVQSVVTDDNGKYLFADLEPGNYYLEFIVPTGFTISPIGSAADGVDSDADPSTKRTAVITLDPGENDMTWDAGIYDETAVAGIRAMNSPKVNSGSLPITGSDALSILIASIASLFAGFLIWGIFKRRGDTSPA